MVRPNASNATYKELLVFPYDNVRREILEGDLYILDAPSTRHQEVVGYLLARFFELAETNGGHALTFMTVYFSDRDVVLPDLLYLAPESSYRAEEQFIRGAPDIIVEVSSPETRWLELVLKRQLYERNGVQEYWYVDTEADEIYIDYLRGDRYVDRTFKRGDTLESEVMPDLILDVDESLGLQKQAG